MKKKLLLSIVAGAMPLASCGLIAGIKDAMDSDDTAFTLAEAQENVFNLAKTSGLEVKLTYRDNNESGDVSFSAKDGIYWNYYVEDGENFGEATVFDKSAGKIYEYSYEDGKWSYDYSDDISTAGYTEETYFKGISTYLYTGYIYSAMAKKTGTEKVAGRDCDVYTYHLGVLDKSLDYHISFDKETGATLKLDLSAGDFDESDEITFEVKTFKTSGVTAPTLPAPVEAPEE